MAMHYTSELIESILKSPKSREILGWMPMVYDEAYVFLWLLETIGQELDDIESWSEEFQEQVVPQTATWTIPYWEEKYGIASNPEMSIEKRRERIVLKMQERTPMNPYRLEEILSKVTGAAVEIQENTGKNRFTVCFQGGLEAFAVAVEEINRIKPAHTIYTVRYLHDLCVVVKNSYHAGVIFFAGIIARDKRQIGIEERLLDGSWLLDGSVLLDEEEHPWEAKELHGIGVVAMTKVPQRLSVGFSVGQSMNFLIDSCADGSMELSGKAMSGSSVELPETEILMEVSGADKTYDGEIEVKEDFWQLDGSVPLDGSRALDAEEYIVKL